MFKVFFLSFFFFFFCFNGNSQISDTINIGDFERQFRDSIALLNDKNQQLKASRDFYNKGLLLLEKDNYSDAIENFNHAIRIDSLFAAAYLGRARSYQSIDIELSIADYRTVFSLDTTSLSSLYSIAALQLKFDRLLAKYTYNSIVAINNNEYKAYSQLGVISFLDKDYQEAERLFTESLNINKNAYTLNDRGSCYRKLGNFDAAIKDYLEAIMLNNTLAFVYNNLASVYVKKGVFEQALAYYDLAISKDINYALAYSNKASLLLEKKEYEKADLAIEKALIANSEYAPAYNNKGVIFHARKKYSDAIVSFNKAIMLDKNYAKAYLNRGISKQMLRDEDGACSDWNKAKEFGIIIAKKYLESDCE